MPKTSDNVMQKINYINKSIKNKDLQYFIMKKSF